MKCCKMSIPLPFWWWWVRRTCMAFSCGGVMPTTGWAHRTPAPCGAFDHRLVDCWVGCLYRERCYGSMYVPVVSTTTAGWITEWAAPSSLGESGLPVSSSSELERLGSGGGGGGRSMLWVLAGAFLPLVLVIFGLEDWLWEHCEVKEWMWCVRCLISCCFESVIGSWKLVRYPQSMSMRSFLTEIWR